MAGRISSQIANARVSDSKTKGKKPNPRNHLQKFPPKYRVHPSAQGDLGRHSIKKRRETTTRAKPVVPGAQLEPDEFELHTPLYSVDRRRSRGFSGHAIVNAARRKLVIRKRLQKCVWVPNQPAPNTARPEAEISRIRRRSHRVSGGGSLYVDSDTDDDADNDMAWEKETRHKTKSRLFYHHEGHDRASSSSSPSSSCAVHGTTGCPPGGGATCWVMYPYEQGIAFQGQSALVRMRARLKADAEKERLRQAEEGELEILEQRQRTLEKLEAWVVRIVPGWDPSPIGEGAAELGGVDGPPPGLAGWRAVRLGQALRTAMHAAKVRADRGAAWWWLWHDRRRTWRDLKYEYYFRPRVAPEGTAIWNEKAWDVLQNQARSGWRMRPGMVMIEVDDGVGIDAGYPMTTYPNIVPLY